MTGGSETSITRLKPDETVILLDRIAQLAAAGLPLEDGLEAAADELPRRAAAAMREVARELQAGRSLEQALTAGQHRLPAHLRGLLMAGLRTGQLGQVLQQHLQGERHMSALRRQARLTLAYPVLLVALIVGISLFFAGVVSEGLGAVFHDFGTELPGQTQFFLSVASVAVPVASGMVLGLLAIWLVDRLLLNRRILGTVAMLLPILGPLRQWLSMVELCRLLGLLIKAEIPLPEALALAAGATRDPLVRRDVEHLSQRVAAGQGLSQAAQRTWLPPTFAALTQWGEGAAALSQSLTVAAELYEERALAEIKLLRAVAPALAFVVVLLAVSFLLSAALLPMVKIIETLT